jgi:hypothetical protein
MVMVIGWVFLLAGSLTLGLYFAPRPWGEWLIITAAQTLLVIGVLLVTGG